MPNITQVRETKRGRWALFSGDEFLFSVDGETLIKHGIREGSSLSDGELSSLKEASDTRKAKDQALRFLSRRAYGKRELYEKLCRTHDEYSAKAAVDSMEELGLLNDGEFALLRAEGLAAKDKSRLEIRMALTQQGVDGELTENTLDAMDLDDAETALRIVRKKYTEKLEQGKNQAVMAALGRRGFSRSDIFSALDAVRNELEEE